MLVQILPDGLLQLHAFNHNRTVHAPGTTVFTRRDRDEFNSIVFVRVVLVLVVVLVVALAVALIDVVPSVSVDGECNSVAGDDECRVAHMFTPFTRSRTRSHSYAFTRRLKFTCIHCVFVT